MSAFLDALDRDLARPLLRLSARELAEIWTHDDVVARVVLPPDFEELPDLNIRLRGAFMRVLCDLSGDSPQRLDPFGRPTAWDVLDRYQPPIVDGLRIARPVLLHSRVAGTGLEVRVRLFGHARWWRPHVALALRLALEGGVRLKSKGVRVPLPVVDQAWQRFDGVAVSEGAPGLAILRFLSPVLVRRGHRMVADPVAILMGAVRRVAALAPWMDVKLDHDPGGLRECAHSLKADMDRAIPGRFLTFSMRQPRDAIPVSALFGEIRYAGTLAPFLPYLVLAEHTGIGSTAAKGLGQVDVILA